MDRRTNTSRSGVHVPIVLGPFIALLPVALSAQAWVVGTPVNAVLSHAYLYAGSCTPDPSHRFSFPTSPVTGVDYAAIVTLAYPGGSIILVPGPLDPLQTGDTIWITDPSDRELFYPLGGGTVQLEFRAIGTPSVAGEAHPCSVNDAWISDLGICPETVSITLLDDCATMLVASVAGIPGSGAWCSATGATAGSTLVIDDPSIASITLYDAHGRAVRAVELPGPGPIEVGDLSHGVYTVRAIGRDRSVRTSRFACMR